MSESESFLLELTVYPAIFAIWKGRGLPAQGVFTEEQKHGH